MDFRKFASPRLLVLISALFIGIGALVWAQLGAPAEAGNSGAPLLQSQPGATNLAAAANGVGQVSLTWTAAPNATGYLVWSVKSNGTGGKWTDAGAATTSFVLTGLEPNTNYWFILLAYAAYADDAESRSWSEFSNWASARTRDTAQPPAPSRYSAISAGDLHTCGLKLDGGVDCFGSDGRGQSSPPAGEFLQVSAGGVHTCGVKADGTVECWGSTAVPSPPGNQRFAQVSSGDNHSCGLTAWPGGDVQHKVICWGATGLGRTDDFEGGLFYSRITRIEAVDAGDNHNCVVTSDDELVRCWGSNDSGQRAHIADGQQVSAGGAHTCWLNPDGTVGCQGDNTSGQSTPPVASEEDFDQEPYTYSAISAGKEHTCAIEADGNSVQTVGTVRCWGSNDAGQSTPPSGVVFDKISAGSNHTCGLKADGSVRCWGDNSYGQAPTTR